MENLPENEFRIPVIPFPGPPARQVAADLITPPGIPRLDRQVVADFLPPPQVAADFLPPSQIDDDFLLPPQMVRARADGLIQQEHGGWLPGLMNAGDAHFLHDIIDDIQNINNLIINNDTNVINNQPPNFMNNNVIGRNFNHGPDVINGGGGSDTLSRQKSESILKLKEKLIHLKNDAVQIKEIVDSLRSKISKRTKTRKRSKYRNGRRSVKRTLKHRSV